MKRFLIKLFLGFLLFVVVNAILIFAVPKDQNNYYFAYQDKINRLEELSEPRLIFMGGSSVAYSTNTKLIADSLKMNAVNMGLHAGIGIRYLMDDLLQYIRKGDVVVVQIEYGNLVSGGNGDPENLPEFMVINNWGGISHLNIYQWKCIARGLPLVAYGNFKRSIKYMITHTWDHSTSGPTYIYGRDVFNEYGDEILHYKYPNVEVLIPSNKRKITVSDEFFQWLKLCLDNYRREGAKVVVLPPVCIQSKFKSDYDNQMAEHFYSIGYPYAVDPEYMSLPDSCAFNTGYHMNADGTMQNSQKMARILRNCLNDKCSRNNK